MEFDFNNKLVLVTGSSRGIGLGIAKRFLKLNARVIFNSTKKVDLDFLLKDSKKSNAFFVTADVSCPNQAHKLIRDIVDKYGLINHIVCNVGSGRSVMPGEETYQEWQRIFSLNLWSTTNIIEASRNFFKSDGGSIVCISSICGAEYIPNAPITYSVAKAALNSYVKNISIPLSKKGVRINSIAPGNILFKNSVWEKKLNENYTEVNKLLNNEVPLKKLGTIDDVANLCVWLSSDYASFSTGSIYNLDGGQLRSY